MKESKPSVHFFFAGGKMCLVMRYDKETRSIAPYSQMPGLCLLLQCLFVVCIIKDLKYKVAVVYSEI